MNSEKINLLLKKWKELIEKFETSSKQHASKNNNGLTGRINRTTGSPVIFDFKTYNDHKKIQNSLCKESPQYSDIILSKPEIMDGYAWRRCDFIELYFEHFRIVIEKLKRITSK